MSWLATTVFVLAMANAEAPANDAEPLDRFACAALRALDLAEAIDEDARIIDAAVWAPAGELPAFCRVVGQLGPALPFEVLLPVREWNGTLRVTSCALPCGDLQLWAVDAVAQPSGQPPAPLSAADLERLARAAQALVTAYFGAEEIETIITVGLAPP
jgi:hypothetical protein